MKLVPVRSLEAKADCEPDQSNWPPQATSTLKVATNDLPAWILTFWIRMCWPEALTLLVGCGAVVEVSTFNCGGTTMSADWIAVVLVPSLVTDSCTVATLFPANTDVAAGPQAGVGVAVVAFWTQISKFRDRRRLCRARRCEDDRHEQKKRERQQISQPHPSRGIPVRKIAHVSLPRQSRDTTRCVDGADPATDSSPKRGTVGVETPVV